MPKRKLKFLVVDQNLRGKAAVAFDKGRKKFLRRAFKHAQEDFLLQMIGSINLSLCAIRDSITHCGNRDRYNLVGFHFEYAVLWRDQLCMLGDSAAKETWTRRTRKAWNEAFSIYNECEALVILLMYPAAKI